MPAWFHNLMSGSSRFNVLGLVFFIRCCHKPTPLTKHIFLIRDVAVFKLTELHSDAVYLDAIAIALATCSEVLLHSHVNKGAIWLMVKCYHYADYLCTND